MKKESLLLFAVLLISVITCKAQPDINRPVGTIPGEVSVSMSGAATYTIPVRVPAGVAGLQPNLSLIYNSQINDGIAGYGWSLSEISSITRGPQDKYYNGIVKPVQGNSEDNFYLDGQLLMPISGINGGDGTQYKAEKENCLKIESFGGSNGNPTRWRITQKDGSRKEYGVKEQDKLTANAVIRWMISSAIDVNDNILTYDYDLLDGEILLERIAYGNNAVLFDYDSKCNTNILFENGKKLINSKILVRINLVQDDVIKQKLELHHKQEVGRDYLMNVELFATDGQSLITKFDYGIISAEETAFNLQGTYEAYGYNNWSLTPGDYNGDGKSDLVVANIIYKVQDNDIKSTTSSLYNLVTNAGIPSSSSTLQSSKLELQSSYSSNTYLKDKGNSRPYSYLSMDMDGDGKDELLKIAKTLNTYQDSRGDWHTNNMFYINNISIDKFGLSASGVTQYTSILSLPSDYTGIYNFTLRDANSLIQGDFDGDGSVDIINMAGRQYQSGEDVEKRFNIFLGWYIYRITPTYDYTYKSFFTSKVSGETNREIGGLTDQIKDAQAVYPIDFDGDAKQELLVLNKNGFVIYSIEKASTSSGYTLLAKQIHSSYQIGASQYKKVLMADFNGDKKTDILAATSSKTITLLYGTGTGFISSSINLPRLLDFESAWPDKLLVGDFNGDGLADIMHAYRNADTYGGPANYHPQQDIYYMKGLSNRSSQTFQTAIVCPQDFSYWVTNHSDAVITGYTDDYSCYTGQLWPYEYEQAYEVAYDYRNVEIYTLIYSLKSNYFDQISSNYLLPLETGDFNGDGKTDVIQSLTGNRYSAFYFSDILDDKNSGKLQKVTDGFGNVITVVYNTLAAGGPDLYTVSSGAENVYPYNTTSLPIKVVSAITQPDGTAGTQTLSYKYNDAVIHRLKGLLGFKGIIFANSTTEQKTESFSSLHKDYNVLLPQENRCYQGDVLVSETHTNTVITTLPHITSRLYNVGRYRIESQEVTVIDQLSKSSVSSSFSYDDFGNITAQVSKTGSWSGNGIDAIETVSTLTKYTQAGKAILPYQPAQVSFTTVRKGASPVTRVTGMSYTDDRGLLTSKTSFYGTPLATTIRYTYDKYGNVIHAHEEIPQQQDINTSISYDESHRFAIQTQVQSSIFTSVNAATYEAYWGKPLTQTHGDGTTGSLTASYQYDGFGNLTSTVTPLGHRIAQSLHWELSDGSLYYHFIDYPAGVAPDEKIWYNRTGNIIKRQTLGWNDQWATETIRYDNKGRMIETTMPSYAGESILSTSYKYDNLNRLTSQITPFGITRYTYSVAGNGESTTTIINPASQISSHTKDATGKIVSVTDQGGTLTYSYNSMGNQTASNLNGETVVSSIYDAYGRQIQIKDINAGSVNYDYDWLNRVIKQTDANGNVTTVDYDALGRISQKSTKEGITKYEYYNEIVNKEVKRIINSSTIEEYAYDNFRRLIAKNRVINGTGSFLTSYSYDAQGNQSAIVYPNNIRIENRYNNAAMLVQVLKDGHTLYKATSINGLDQVTQFTSSNGIQSDVIYDTGVPVRYYTPYIQDLNFDFDRQTATLSSRYDAMNRMKESFTYDNLNRLTSSEVNNNQQFSISYDGSHTSRGNIVNKTDVGNYIYQINRPNAIAYINKLHPSLNIDKCQVSVAYTSFQRPAKIIQDGKTLDFVYGVDDERIKTVQTIHQQTETRVFLDNYERQILSDGTTNEIIYVNGGNGICSMIVNGEVFSVYKDYLGSILAITDSTGEVIANQNFDAWGRKRNASNWSYENIEEVPAWLIRGYTGHEDLAAFGLINANARLYDPLTGRMISPDSYVPNTYSTQGYNRYSYANNNPLLYTDPDGNVAFIDDVLLGLVGGVINVGSQLISGNVSSVWQGVKYFGVGFVAGVTSEYTLGMGSGMILGAGNAWVAGGSAGDVVTGGVLGGVSAGIGTSLSGIVSPYISSWTSGLGTTASSALTTVGTSTIVGGTMGAGISGLTGGDIGTGFRNGLSTGFATGAMGAGLSIGKSYLDGRRVSDKQTSDPNLSIEDPVPADPRRMELMRVRGVNSPNDRTEPATLEEHLTLLEAKAGPGQHIRDLRINDGKWNGWLKMTHSHRLPDGQNITIHWWHNPFTGENVGYKFKNPPLPQSTLNKSSLK